VRLAAAFVDEGTLDVLRLEELPEAAPLTAFLKTDEETRRLAQEAVRIGDAVHLPVEFHDLLTHNAKEALHRHAVATKAEWIVLEWPSHRELHFVIRHPMAWWIDHAPCDVAVFLDRQGRGDGDTSDDFRRILILAETGPYDSLVVHVADRLARDQTGNITLFLPMAEDATDEEVAEQEAYHRQLGLLCGCEIQSRIVRTSDRYGAIRDTSLDFDLLIIGAPREGTWRTLLFGSHEHRVAEAAACSVLKLKAPRHHVHRRLTLTEDETGGQPSLAVILADAAIGHRVQAARKADLFAAVGEALAERTEGTPEAIAQALASRERMQSTALKGGVAITAPSLAGLKKTTLAVLTTAHPVEFQGPKQPKVDVMIVVLAPPGERQTQLWLVDQMSRIVVRGDLLPALRAAGDKDAMREAIRAAVSQSAPPPEEG
jgi:mannitol/fructose-specific phosphotransferase system IIA component (Ntr-type)/nucleotide-binding universal stress UspA family protein